MGSARLPRASNGRMAKRILSWSWSTVGLEADFEQLDAALVAVQSTYPVGRRAN